VSLRVKQKEQTFGRIFEAALELIREGGEDAVTMRAVARKVGVTERTIYRHFESRDVLLQAVWKALRELIRAGPRPRTADALAERPRRLFPQLDERPELMRAYLRAVERRELSLRTKEARQTAMFECVEDALGNADHRSLRWRAAIVDFITSAYAWEFMERYWGFDGEEAGEAAAQAVEILLDRRLAY
jgi:AcrR family transcriptional regulator